MTHVRHPHGLTLVEMLAAIVLLAAVGAACIAILRDASAVARGLPAEAEARDALDAWLLRPVLDGEAEATGPPWAWMSASGARWTVSTPLDDAPAPVPAASGDGGAVPTTMLRLQWAPITLTCDAAADTQWTFWRVQPVPEPEEGAP